MKVNITVSVGDQEKQLTLFDSENSAPMSVPMVETTKKNKTEKMVNINYLIPHESRKWLNEKADECRFRAINSEVKIPKDQLISERDIVISAIELLINADLDWTNICTINELKNELNILVNKYKHKLVK